MDIPNNIEKQSQILGFSGEFRFLSNFHPVAIEYAGHKFGSTEAAYQAAKAKNPEDIAKFVGINAGASKRLGRTIELREDWDQIKDAVMFQFTCQKFLVDKELRAQLLATGDSYIEETNFWHDIYWGVDGKTGKGKNQLGKTLMYVRGLLGGTGIVEKVPESEQLELGTL